MRLALGATARQLVTLVVGQALRPVLVGALLGVGAAFASGRLLDGLLFEIGPTDPGSFGTATVLLLAIALLASYVPARRASRAAPFVTLKITGVKHRGRGWSRIADRDVGHLDDGMPAW